MSDIRESVPLTRAEWVDRRLREAIITGEIGPGEKLMTEELARRWGVSPTPLRETYQRLAAEGLVELTPQRGARVAEMSREDLRDVYATRLLLEPHALSLSLEHCDDDWRAAVTDAYRPLRDELERGMPDAVVFETAHGAFHRALIERCDSPWMLRLIHMLQGHCSRYRLQSLGLRGGTEDVLQEHDELLEACFEGERDVAVERLRAHLQLTIDSLQQIPDDQLLAPEVTP